MGNNNERSLPAWEASWIWGDGPDSPRNAWRCFRRAFVPADGGEAASVRIAADSRYVLYVNGQRVGRGPVRSWPFELPYDEYEIGHLLTPGARNVIAVLVLHYGVSTFQYLRGRGALLLQLDGVRDELGGVIATDGAWRTAVHAGYDANTSRISCQLGFQEVLDARAIDERWVEPGYDDGGWEAARVVGPVGTAPWTTLVPRPIPYLTEEPVYPSRVEALHAVRPPAWTCVLDVRAAMAPESADHANNVAFCGLLATHVALERDASLTIGVVDSGRLPVDLSVDGRRLPEDVYSGEHPERYATVELAAGEHFLLFDVTGVSHGHAFHLAMDAGGVPFEVRSPLARPDDGGGGSPTLLSPFAAIGAFDQRELIDHRPGAPLSTDHPDYARARGAASAADLAALGGWVRPVDPQLVNLQGVFAANVWKTHDEPRPVPVELQRAALPSPDPAIVPVFGGADTELVIDFGRELSGYVELVLDAPEGAIVDGCGFEYMRDGWRQHTYLVDNTFRYVCRAGRQTFASVVRRGLRYLALTIRGASRPVKLYEVKLLQSNFPVANVGRFRSSDALLNDIWTISRETTRLCMEDTFVDCPAFEQVFWVGDARNEALVNYYTFGARDIVEHCLRLVPGSAFQTPLFADQVPSGWNSVIPNWTFFWVTACLEYYRFDGGQPFVEQMWPHVRFTLDHYLALRNEQGLLERAGWNLLDWAPFEQPGDGVVTPQNMFLVKALRDAAELGEAAGDGDEAARFRAEADRLAERIDRLLWDDARSAYVDCLRKGGTPSETVSMQTHIVAYLCDIASGERKRLIERYLIEPPASFVPAGSPFMLFFYYEALAKLGRVDVMIDDIRRHYGFMIENDATSCWEMFPWSGYNKNPKLLTRSHCHAWSAAPGYFLGAHVLGVQGMAPGWTAVRVAPQPSGLAWASGSVPLPQGGRIDVSWRVSDGRKLHMRIEAPASVALTTEPPEGYEMTVETVTY